MRRKLFFRFALFLIVAFCIPAADACAAVLVSGESPVAMRTYGVWEQDTGERFDFAVYYPGGSSDTPLVREGRLIETSYASRIHPGFYPIILFSHDTAGSRFANGDLAVAIASRGFVVIAPTHAGDNQNDSDRLYTAALVRDRPRQMLWALDILLGLQEFASSVDESRIGVLGVGFGCITVMQLAGARPDFSVLEEYCRPFDGRLDPGREPFCLPWVRERLGRIPQTMAMLEQTQGNNVFTPGLDLFAPVLDPVPAECALTVSVPGSEEEKQTSDATEGRTLLQRLFNLAPDPEKEPEPRAEEARAEHASAMAAATARWDPFLDFQEHSFFSETEVSDVFVVRMNAMLQWPALTGDPAEIAPPLVPPARPSAPPVYRRPADLRRIGAIGLAMPAGGMLFPKESLEKIPLPIALLMAGDDGLYNPERHAQPYADLLHAQSLVLNLQGVDHFSLFAPCNKELAATLGDVCGQLAGDEREQAVEARDVFFASFFQSVLGGVKAPPEPSGLVAAKGNGEKQISGSGVENKGPGGPVPGRQAVLERTGKGGPSSSPGQAATQGGRTARHPVITQSTPQPTRIAKETP